MPKDATKKKPSKRIQMIAYSAIGTIGVALLALGVIGLTDYLVTTTQGEDVPSSAVVTEDTGTPSEKKPEATQQYTVPAEQPRRLSIEKLNVSSLVQKVGVTKDTQMAAPNNIFFSGWYVDSVAPGKNGVSIINGHAGGRYEQGVFRNLGTLVQKDTIKVEMGNLSWRVFEVVSVDTYAVDESSKALFKDDPSIQQELHLITCDGVFDDTAQTYDKRTIVVAKRVS